MDKISNVQIGQAIKTAAASLRALSEENGQLREKVAHFERKERAESLASKMEEKGLQPELNFSEKVAGLLRRDNLDAVEEAIGLSAPQTKLASIHDDQKIVVEGQAESDGSSAESNFAASLASID